MIFYEIHLKEIPKFIFACSVEEKNYVRKFDYQSHFLELSVIEDGETERIYEDGQVKHLYPKMFVSVFYGMNFRVKAFKNQLQRHTTVGVNVDYEYKEIDSDSKVDIKEIKERVKRGESILIPENMFVEGEFYNIKSIIKKISKLLISQNPGSYLLALSEWFNLCQILSSIVLKNLDNTNEKAPSSIRYVDMAQEYINNNLDKQMEVCQIAENLNLSSGYLHKIFKDITGMTIVSYINKQKIDMAMQHIQFRGLSLREASRMVGITDEAYMSRLFKKVSGITYKQFKEQKG